MVMLVLACSENLFQPACFYIIQIYMNTIRMILSSVRRKLFKHTAIDDREISN